MKRNAFALLLASAAFWGPSIGYAQDASEPEAVPNCVDANGDGVCDEQATTSTDSGSIVVTGSRLRRSEFTSASPVQVITKETSALEGLIDTSQILQESALAAGTFQVNNQLTGFVTQGGPGANSVQLRGLGDQRTLVIMNGRRIGPAGTRGQVQAVDLNTIPSSIIQRVEVLTDGASSIYGSEALGGVVNIITRNAIDGFEANLAGSLPVESGGEQYSIDAAYGKVLDRGYFNVSAQFSKVEPLRTADREYLECQEDYLFTPDGTARRDHIDSATGEYKCYGLFANVLRANPGPGTMDLFYPGPGVNTAVEGNNSPVVGMARQGRAGYPETYSYANYQDPLYLRRTVLSPRENTSVFATAGFDITPNIELFGEFLYSRRESSQDGVRQFFPLVWTDHPGATRPDTGGFFAGSTILPIIPLTSDGSQEVDYGRALVGLRGDFGGLLDSWSWDLVGQYSKSDATYTYEFIYNDRVEATTLAFDPITFETLGCDDVTFNVSNFSCSDLGAAFIPWTSARVLAGDFNAAESAFLFGEESGQTTYEHQYVEGTATGDLFQLPFGSIAAAVGFQIRKEEIDDQPGPNQAADNLWGSTSATRTAGSDTVREVFAEFEVPLLKGLPLAEDLTVNVSGRYSDYDSYGASETYKVGLNYQIVPWLRVRASQGTSFRAPSLYEQYLGNLTGFLGQTSVEPCINWGQSSNQFIQANCAAVGLPDDYTAAGTSSALIITGGGRDVLEPETGESRTVGVIWTPDFFNLNIAVDYWEVEVNDQITQFGAGNIAFQCYSSPTFPNDPFCSLVTRAPADSLTSTPLQIETINDSYVNVAAQTARGLDLNVRYTHDASIGKFTYDGRFFWTFEDEVSLLSGSTDDYLGTTYGYRGPDFTAEMNLRYDRQDWTVQWSVDLIGKGSDTEVVEGDVFTSTRYANVPAGQLSTDCTTPADENYCVYYKQYTEFTSYHDITVRKTFDDWSITGGLLNIFDEEPPSASAGQFRVGTSALNGYDIVGRRLYFLVSKTW